MKTAEKQNTSRNLAGNTPALATKRTGDAQPRRNSSTGSAAATDRTRSQEQELEGVRREYAKLQQAIYEAAQVQRKLCSPRELVWGEYEIGRNLCGTPSDRGLFQGNATGRRPWAGAR